MNSSGPRAGKPAAPPVYRPQTLQRKAAPPVYKPAAPAPVQRATAPSVYRPPARPLTGNRSIQRHPLSIRIEGYKNWDRDTGNIDFDADLRLYSQRIGDPTRILTSLQVRKRRDQDHQVMVVGTNNDTLFTQMDLTPSGAIVRQGQSVEQDFYGELVTDYDPGGHTLGDAFRAFFETARGNGYEGEDYDCRRFLRDVLTRLPRARPKPSRELDMVKELFG